MGPAPGPPGKLLDWGREVGETAPQAEAGQGGEGAEKKAKSAVRSSCSGILQGLHQLW